MELVAALDEVYGPDLESINPGADISKFDVTGIPIFN